MKYGCPLPRNHAIASDPVKCGVQNDFFCTFESVLALVYGMDWYGIFNMGFIKKYVYIYISL